MKSKQEIMNQNENLKIPAWITVEFFKDIVAKTEPESVSIANFTPVPAVPSGENFTSIMLRIHMDLVMRDGSFKKKTYILKTVMDDAIGSKFVANMGLFPKEMKMYKEYIPAFEELYKSIGWNIKFAPKCLLAEHQDDHINFIFEDMTEYNFENIDRFEGCNMIHMQHVLRKLAQLHAASAVYQERNGEFPESLQKGFVNLEEGADFHKSLIQIRMDDYKNAMRQWGLENVEKCIQKFPTKEQYWKCCLETLNKNKNGFNVLTHGDFWSSNIMFNYLPTGELNKLIFVDFQFCKWGSPAEDLLMFITISAAKDIRVKEFDYFIAFYHEQLVECLKALAYEKPLPELRDLHKELFDKKHSFYAFFSCFNHLTMIMLPNDKDSSINNYCRDDEYGREFRFKAFTNPRYVEAMKQLFPFYSNKGVFNFTEYD